VKKYFEEDGLTAKLDAVEIAIATFTPGGVTPPECTEHVDADNNGKCDNCDADVEKKPDDDKRVVRGDKTNKNSPLAPNRTSGAVNRPVANEPVKAAPAPAAKPQPKPQPKPAVKDDDDMDDMLDMFRKK
jgi:hypothetical protein